MIEIIAAIATPLLSALIGALLALIFYFEIIDKLKIQRELYIKLAWEFLICIDEVTRSIALLDYNIHQYALSVKDCRAIDKEKTYISLEKYIVEFYKKSEDMFHKLTFYQIIFCDFNDIKFYLHKEFKGISKIVNGIRDGVLKSDSDNQYNKVYITELAIDYNKLYKMVKIFQNHLQDLSNELQIKYLKGIYEKRIKRRKPVGKDDLVLVTGKKYEQIRVD